MFGSITRGIKNKVVDKAVEKLSAEGKASLDGIGTLYYHRDTNSVDVKADHELLDRVKQAWDLKHDGH